MINCGNLNNLTFTPSVFRARDSRTVELFLEMDEIKAETKCDGLLLLHECIKNIPEVYIAEVSYEKQDCSQAIIEMLSYQVNIYRNAGKYVG